MAWRALVSNRKWGIVYADHLEVEGQERRALVAEVLGIQFA
jgi:hypothetical protein